MKMMKKEKSERDMLMDSLDSLRASLVSNRSEICAATVLYFCMCEIRAYTSLSLPLSCACMRVCLSSSPPSDIVSRRWRSTTTCRMSSIRTSRSRRYRQRKQHINSSQRSIVLRSRSWHVDMCNNGRPVLLGSRLLICSICLERITKPRSTRQRIISTLV